MEKEVITQTTDENPPQNPQQEQTPPQETEQQVSNDGSQVKNADEESKTPNGLDNKETKDENKDNEIYGSPENFDYSTTVLPEGMELDKELIDEFEPIARKLNLSNQSANELMGLAVKLAEKNFAKVGDISAEVEQREKIAYAEMLNNDKELNITDETKYNQYVDVAIEGLKAVATKGFSDFIAKKGLTHHPEFIKTFHNIGKLCTSSSLPDVHIPAGKKQLETCDILYGQRNEE